MALTSEPRNFAEYVGKGFLLLLESTGGEDVERTEWLSSIVKLYKEHQMS